MKRIGLILGIFAMIFLQAGILYAQSGRVKAANREFENLSYLNAIRLYEDFLRLDKKKDLTEHKDVLTRLGYSYRRMNDSRNAERIYADLMGEFNDLESESYLYYAQALASNGKYRDAQKMYSKYGEMQTADLRGRRFTVSYMDVNRFYQDSSSYKVDYLPINSRQADFSPMYYKAGLVFVSAREEAGMVKRAFMWNQTPFLDLYFAGDTTELRQGSAEVSGAGLGGALSTNQILEKTTKDDITLSKAELFSRTLNTKYHEGPVCFFIGEEKMIFTRNNYNKGKYRESTEGINKLKLYIADFKNGKWGDAKELPFNSNDYSCGHPTLSPDNTKLYFISDMPGGFGGTDLYVVEYNNGMWGSPVNMGKDINTEGNEMFPFADSNGNLYFASDGQEGLGGLDIFFIEIKNGIPAGDVANMGFPINSEKDDFGLITDGNRSSGYFASNRKKGIGDDNLYSFRKMCKQLNVLVLDADSKQPLEKTDVRIIRDGINQELRVTNADGGLKMCLESNTEYEFKAIKEGYETASIKYSTRSNSSHLKTQVVVYMEKSKGVVLRGKIKSEVTKAPIAGAKVILKNEKNNSEQSVVTGADGGYEFDIKPNTIHKLVAQKDNYATNDSTITKVKSGTRGAKIIDTDLGLIGEGDVFRIDNIYYDLNSFFIRPDAAHELDGTLVPILKKYPKLKIEIRSHTDSRASSVYNTRLSENRARAVVDFLVQRGIKPERLVSRGFGETALLNNCGDGINCSENEHQQNRRTEFKVLSVK